MKGRAITYHSEDLDWIEARKALRRAELHRLFQAFWQRDDVSQANLTALCKRRGWLTGRTGHFAKGHVSHNKGRPMPPEVRVKVMATAFKPSHRPANHRGPGHERIDSKDGYVVMVVDERNPWNGHATGPVHKHRYLWERLHGPVPKGHVLKCLNGDKTNCDLSNWRAIPQAMLPLLNGRWSDLKYDDAPAELKPAVMAVAGLDHMARLARKRKA